MVGRSIAEVNILPRSKNGGYRPKSHIRIHNFQPYGMLIHLNSVNLRIKSSVCVIVLTESIATYGCPSFEWFWQSGDNSNVCSTHPYTFAHCVLTFGPYILT